MKKKKNNFDFIFFIAMVVIAVILVVGVIGLEIYLWITYGGKPVGEIPAWVLFFLWGK